MIELATVNTPATTDICIMDDGRILLNCCFDFNLYMCVGKYPALTTSHDWAEFLSNALELSALDCELLMHDINNLRVDEWFETFKDCGISDMLFNEFKLWLSLTPSANIYIEYIPQTDSIRAYYDNITDGRGELALSYNDIVFFRKLMRDACKSQYHTKLKTNCENNE